MSPYYVFLWDDSLGEWADFCMLCKSREHAELVKSQQVAIGGDAEIIGW